MILYNQLFPDYSLIEAAYQINKGFLFKQSDQYIIMQLCLHFAYTPIGFELHFT